MDYTTNTLSEQLECKDELLHDFSDLKYGTIGSFSVFDATRFCAERGIESFDYKIFQRVNKWRIEALIKYADVDRSSIFHLNHDGHILIHHELTFLFLSFVLPSLSVYFNGLIGELLSNGVAYSDGFVVSLAAQRIPTELLQQIINDRKDEQKQ